MDANMDKLIELIKLAQGDRTLNQFAQKCDIDAGNLSRILNKKNKKPPTLEIIKKISENAYNGVTYADLILAAGYIEGSTASEVLEALLKLNDNSSIFKIEKPFENRKNIIPILGTIRAGIPLLAEENWDSQVEIPADLNADFALRVTGDSMSWVGIYDGDLAILRQSNVANHGDIVAAGVNDEHDWSATLKFFVKENGTPVLRAANPDYQDIQITNNHKIIGQLVSVQKQPPSLSEYRDFLVKKDIVNTGWQDTVEKALSYGLNSSQVDQMIELFSHMVKQVK